MPTERNVGDLSPEASFRGSAGVEDRSTHGEGRRGTWEVLSSPSPDGTAEQARVSEAGEQEVGARR